MSEKRIPPRVAPRLSCYHRALLANGGSWISSRELSSLTGFTAAQIRRDLAYFGHLGSPGKGYNGEELSRSLRRILGLDRRWKIALIGAGNLGAALLGYRGFRTQGFDIVAAFDSDPRKVGRTVNGVRIHALAELPATVRERGIRMAIIAVPVDEAQAMAERAAESGINAFLNFAPVNLRLPLSVKVRNIDMSQEIENLSFLVSHNR